MNKTSASPHFHTSPDVTLGIMAKFWEPGTVKTRLAADIGTGNAALIHRAFCQHLSQQLAAAATRRNFCVAPDRRETQFAAEFSPQWRIQTQSHGDLGNRIRHWFIDQTPSTPPSAGHAAVLIGADCPLITPETITHAVSMLEHHELVLGPAVDGGYYLIAIRMPWKTDHEPLLSEIPWSSDAVLQTTLDRAQQIGWQVGLLPPQEDIDTLGELLRLGNQLNERHDPPSQQLAQTLREILGDDWIDRWQTVLDEKRGSSEP